MDFCRTTFHIVQQGDTFYRLAQQYRTTVPDIIQRNPGINPYNLQVGTRLRICVGRGNETLQQEETDLNNDMRMGWNQYNFWTTMFMNSLFHNLDNKNAVENRLMQTPGDIASVFGKFYSQAMVNQLKQLLTEHTQLAGELMGALQAGNMDQADQIESQMYQNGDQIARMLANANSRYDYEELRRMFRMHIDTLKNTMMADLNHEYDNTVRLIDENENHLMGIADALTEGLMEQFYQRTM